MLSPLIFFNFIDALSVVIIRAITGLLLSDREVKEIAQEATEHLLRFDPFGPIRGTGDQPPEKIAIAQNHIRSASAIIGEIAGELEAQSIALENLTAEFESKRKVAAEYEQLAATNEAAAEAFTNQMRRSIATELEERSRKGRNMRRFTTLFIWFITLVSGAALGHYFSDILGYFSELFRRS